MKDTDGNEAASLLDTIFSTAWSASVTMSTADQRSLQLAILVPNITTALGDVVLET